jgi:hypothetical protein
MRFFLLMIYVDDILVLANEAELKRIEEFFKKEFTWITMNVGNVLSYLGMQIMLEQGLVTIDMSYYLEKVLEGYDNLPLCSTPGKKNFFEVDDKAELLSEAQRKMFHTVVARLLYLSKRARPDIMTVVALLCTRVMRATTEDRKKLERVLGYLKGTADYTLQLKPRGILQLEVYMDAAFASHVDSKSQSGIVVYLGGAMVFGALRKQKCVTKSPTESELVALTDHISFAEAFAEFLGLIISEEVRAPTIYQDSTSVISLVTKGGGVVRTKHLRVRMNLGREAVQEKRIKVEYIHTSKILADGLTKVFEGKEFISFRNNLLGIELE